MEANRSDWTLLWIKVLLTLVALEFFGPMIRDLGPSHVFHPDWVGHARLHLVWLLGFMLFSGLANLYLVWFRRPFELRNLWLSVAWQGANLGGFWIAVLFADLYGGVVTMPDTHVSILGWDENVVVFTVLSLFLVTATVLLAGLGRGERVARSGELARAAR